MLLVRGVRLPLDTPRPEAEAAGRAMKILKIRPGDVAGAGVARLSVDARHGRPSLVYTIGVRLKDEGAELALAGSAPCVALARHAQYRPLPGGAPLNDPPVVAGLGPAGLFAALALASLPSDERVMQDPPRKTTDHIITRPMGRNILGVGILFVAFLFGLLQYFKHADITSLTQFSLSGYFRSYLDFSTPEHELTGYELSLFFTIFVLLQFWNMFNAKAFNTHQSAFARMGASIGGFGLVALLILAGQYLIVTFGGKMFNVVPLSWTDWGLIFAGTSLVLWFGELARAFTPDKSGARS